MKKALFIVGPTAVGKTKLSVELSQKIPSVLVSADSIQVYRGADIISGKDHPKEVKIELIDVLSPTESFSVKNFIHQVKPIVEKAHREQRLPIIVGGTGLYVNSLFSTIETADIPQNEELREELSVLTVEELQEKLTNANPEKISQMNDSDKNNPRRLIRAIEVANMFVKPNTPIFQESEILIVGLETSMANLRERIKLRVDERVKEGALKEAESLFKDYDNLSPQLRVANGYKELFAFLKDDLTWEEAVEQWITADYQHAKAQFTWFKKNKNVKWFNLEKDDILLQITHEIGL